MRTNFVLIDAENVKPEYIEKLKHDHFRVFVFVGANQKRLDFPIVNALQTLGSNGSYVQISGHGPDAGLVVVNGKKVTYPTAPNKSNTKPPAKG